MRKVTKCISAALFLLVLLTTCVFAEYPSVNPGAATLYVDINIPAGNPALDTLLRNWVEDMYVPALVQGGVFAGMARGDMELHFDWAFEGTYYASVAMAGALHITRQNQTTTLQVAEHLNLSILAAALLTPWDILDATNTQSALEYVRAAVLQHAPEAAPYLTDMDNTWLNHMLLSADGLLLPLESHRFGAAIGAMTVLLPYAMIADAFLLSYSPDFISAEVQDMTEAPPLWPHADPPETETPPEPTQGMVDKMDALFPEYNPNPRPMIALTFDDGPSRFTETILSTLNHYGGHATFFVLGNRIEEWEDTIYRAHQAGHEIAGHSWRHTDMTRQTRAAATAAIRDTSNAIYNVTGHRSNLFRPPYGAINRQLENIATEIGYGIVLWSIDPQDWRETNQNADHIYNWIISRATDGAIIVLHDIHATTAQAMQRVIPRLINDGFDLVTTTHLLNHHYNGITPGHTYRGLR